MKPFWLPRIRKILAYVGIGTVADGDLEGWLDVAAGCSSVDDHRRAVILRTSDEARVAGLVGNADRVKLHHVQALPLRLPDGRELSHIPAQQKPRRRCRSRARWGRVD